MSWPHTPEDSSPACAHFGKNQRRMFTSIDPEIVNLTLHQLESRGGGKVQVGFTLPLPCPNVLTAEEMPQDFKDSPLLAKFKVPL